MHFPSSSRKIGIKFVLPVLLIACDLDLLYSTATRAPQEISSLVEQQYDSLFHGRLLLEHTMGAASAP